MSPRPTRMPEGTPIGEVVGQLSKALRDAGVPAVLLRAPGVEAGSAGTVESGTWRHDLDVLVPARHRAAAFAAMDELGWRLAVGGIGLWSRVPTVSYHWDYSPSLDVHRGLPAGPLPSRMLRGLERELFSRAKPSPSGLVVPDPAALAVFAAVQAARPGPFREMWLRDLRIHVDAGSRAGTGELAGSLGLGAALRWALAPEAGEVPGRRAGPLFDRSSMSWAWALALELRRRVRPWRLGAALAGMPRGGTAVIRARFAGLELRAGPGAFTPQGVSEPMVSLALDGLPTDGGLAVDVGTGVGAVALAVAHARPDVEVHGCDLSKPALRWAERNRRRLGIGNVRFHRGSLLDPLEERLAGRVDVITGNVPYVPPTTFGPGYRDPDRAVLGTGPDGLDLQRELLRQSIMYLAPQGRLILQMAIDQWEIFTPEMQAWGIRTQPITEASFEDAICWGVMDARGPSVGRKA